MKICLKCKNDLDISCFYRKTQNKDGLNTWCKSCVDVSAKTYYVKTMTPELSRKRSLWNRYKISVEEYDALLIKQNFKCAICHTPTSELQRNLAVDHDHKCCPGTRMTCGKCNRGLLCDNCNRGIGMLKEDAEILRRAIDYLDTTTPEVLY